jgi:heme/copper-type cytochrome/quinol oxidase subunit 1
MIPFFLLFSFINIDSVVDIDEVKWNTIFPLNYYGIGVYLFLLLPGLGYCIKNVEFKSKLTLLHFTTTIVGLFILVLPKLYFLIFSSSTPRRYYSNTIEPSFFDFLTGMNFISQVAIALIIIGVITYFINLGLAIFKK